MRRAALSLTGALAISLLLTGCGPSLDEQRAENRVKDAIAPGIYGSAQAGLILTLPQGSDSATVSLAHCKPTCAPAQTVPMRRGLNGIFFDLPGDGQGHMPALVAVEPAQGGVTLRADWGQGLEEHVLTHTPAPATGDVAPH